MNHSCRTDGTSNGLHKRRHTAHRDSGFGSEVSVASGASLGVRLVSVIFLQRDSVSRTEEHDGRLPSIDGTCSR